MTARTAHGLDTPRGTHWADEAACNRINNRAVDPEWFWPENGLLGQDGMRALHICLSHCPVRARCHAEAVDSPPPHPCIAGGRRYVMFSGRPVTRVSRDEPTTSYGCPYCAGEAPC